MPNLVVGDVTGFFDMELEGLKFESDYLTLSTGEIVLLIIGEEGNGKPYYHLPPPGGVKAKCTLGLRTRNQSRVLSNFF